MRLAAFLVLLLVSTGRAQPPLDSSSLQQLFDRASEAKGNNDLAETEKILRSALAAASAASDAKWQGRFEQSLADLFLSQGHPNEAGEAYSRALAWFEKAGDASDANTALLRLGAFHANLGDFPKAVDYLKRATAGFLTSRDEIGRANTLDVLGQIEARRSNFAEAGQALREALNLYESAANPQRVAKVRGSLADLYRRESEFRLALETGFRALDEDEKAGDRRETAKVLDVLGNTFQMIGQFDNALVYYERARVIREKESIKQDLPISYRNLAAVLGDNERYVEGLGYSRRSLELARAAGSAREIAINLINIGNAELHLDHRELAGQNYHEALDLAANNRLDHEESLALYDLGNLSMSYRKWDEALRFHQQALKLRETRGERRDVVWSLNRLALVEEARSDLQTAAETHARALHLFEEIGSEITDPVQYGAYRQTSVVLFPAYARVLAKLGKTREALLISERGRGVGLERLSYLNGATFSDLLDASSARDWKRCSVALSRASNELRLAEDNARGNDPNKVRVRDEARALYFQRQRELSELRDRLFASTPALLASRAKPAFNTDSLEELVKRSPETLFLEWSLTDEEALVLALSSRQVESFRLPIGVGEIHAFTKAWLDTLGSDSGRGIKVATPFPATAAGESQLAHKLYQAIFEKLEPLLATGNYRRLVLVSEGPLLDIPFGALIDNRGRRLADRYAISSTVSLVQLMRPAVRRPPSRKLLAVADPLGHNEERTVVPSGDRYRALQEAIPEARAVADLYAGSLLLTERSARESEVKRLMPDFEILHFATHGVLDSKDGLRSGLLLATEAIDSEEDGILQGWEITSMSLSARLAVLSACSSGQGNEGLGEGLLGLAWAFQAAGVPRVAASLWNVDDAATRALMTAFYELVRSGTRIDDALQQASKKLRENPRYASPHYWAAFEILGEAGSLLQ